MRCSRRGSASTVLVNMIWSYKQGNGCVRTYLQVSDHRRRRLATHELKHTATALRGNRSGHGRRRLDGQRFSAKGDAIVELRRLGGGEGRRATRSAIPGRGVHARQQQDGAELRRAVDRVLNCRAWRCGAHATADCIASAARLARWWGGCHTHGCCQQLTSTAGGVLAKCTNTLTQGSDRNRDADQHRTPLSEDSHGLLAHCTCRCHITLWYVNTHTGRDSPWQPAPALKPRA